MPTCGSPVGDGATRSRGASGVRVGLVTASLMVPTSLVRPYGAPYAPGRAPPPIGCTVRLTLY
ncbi:hypothetical protein GCM10009814_18940 [Lapillicoccus jejuensis]